MDDTHNDFIGDVLESIEDEESISLGLFVDLGHGLTKALNNGGVAKRASGERQRIFLTKHNCFSLSSQRGGQQIYLARPSNRFEVAANISASILGGRTFQ